VTSTFENRTEQFIQQTYNSPASCVNVKLQYFFKARKHAGPVDMVIHFRYYFFHLAIQNGIISKNNDMLL